MNEKKPKPDVKLYLYCRKCHESKPKNQSISDYSRISVGRTNHGILVWCERHEEPVAHLGYDWSPIDRVKRCECEGCK